jgi:hypothetical protein
VRTVPYESDLRIERIGCNRWRLLDDLVYDGRDDRFTAERGYVTDLASSPRAFQAVVPRTGPWDEGAVTHDKLCSDLRRWYDQVRALIDRGCSKSFARAHVEPPLASARDTDAILRRIIREYHEAGVDGCGPAVQWTVWAGVRWGALANPARREDWWRDLPKVAAISAGLLAVVALVLAAVGLVVAVAWGWMA